MALTKTEQAMVNRLYQRLDGLARRWDESAGNDKHQLRAAAKKDCASQLRMIATQFLSHPVTARAVTGETGKPVLAVLAEPLPP